MLFEAFDDAYADGRELRRVDDVDIERDDDAGIDEEGEVTARLRALGYI